MGALTNEDVEMTDKKDGGPAFPSAEVVDNNKDVMAYAESGMTLRDYFAAKAMAAMIASGAIEYKSETPAQGISRNSYIMADAMLLECTK